MTSARSKTRSREKRREVSRSGGAGIMRVSQEHTSCCERATCGSTSFRADFFRRSIFYILRTYIQALFRILPMPGLLCLRDAKRLLLTVSVCSPSLPPASTSLRGNALAEAPPLA